MENEIEKNKKKDNIIMIILITLIILLIIGICVIVFFLYKNNKNNYPTALNLSNDNETSNRIENINTMLDKNNDKNNNEPNGTAMKLKIGEIKEKEVMNDYTDKADFIYIDDFVLCISGELKLKGYKINLINDDKVLDITSNDNSYNCKIARFSNENPYELTDEQYDELEELYNKIAYEQCEKLGISEDDDNYDEIYEEEYDKIDISNNKVKEYYDNHNINRYTSFSGFTHNEKENAYDLLDINMNDFEFSSSSKAFAKETKYNNNRENKTVTLYEMDDKSCAFAGLFIKLETKSEEDTDCDADFWTFKSFE